MTVLVLPSSAPYDGSAYASFFGVVEVLPLTPASLSDAADSTSVTLRSGQDGAGYHSVIVAVDFAAQPTLVADSSFGTMFRLARLVEEFSGAIFADDSWALFESDGTFVRAGRMSEAVGDPGSVATSPTTYTTDAFYGIGSHAPAIQVAPFTLAMCFRASADDGSSTVVDLYSLYEAGLLLEIADVPLPEINGAKVDDGRFFWTAQ